LLLVERALESATLKRENRRLRTQAMTPDGLIGRSQSVQQLRQMIAKIGPANSRILISGPPGSGKELAARMLHAASPRAKSEFVAVSAADMTPERIDLELFGEEARARGNTIFG
jgi:two-component system nitrogen regulation response regulator NtrX